MSTNKNEIWKEIKGYENLYEISSTGKVRSFPNTAHTKYGGIVNWKSRELKPTIDSQGNKTVLLFKRGEPKNEKLDDLFTGMFTFEETTTMPKIKPNKWDGVKKKFDQVVDGMTKEDWEEFGKKSAASNKTYTHLDNPAEYYTAKQLYDSVVDDSLRERLYNNTPIYMLSENFLTLDDAIGYCFLWDETPEGKKYWEGIQLSACNGKLILYIKKAY